MEKNFLRISTGSVPQNYRSKHRLVNLIRYMGRLYDADIEGIDDFAKFQEILDLVDSNKTTGIFNSRETLAMLAPKCNDYVVACKWGGKFYNCSDLLEMRRTSEGCDASFRF